MCKLRMKKGLDWLNFSFKVENKLGKENQLDINICKTKKR